MGGWWSPRSQYHTDLFTYFAQFVDQDLVRFAKPGPDAQKLPIELSKDEGMFSGNTLPFSRLSKVNTPRGKSPKNELSSFLDASAVYGTTEMELDALRDTNDGCKLATSMNNLMPVKSDNTFLAEDKRANEN